MSKHLDFIQEYIPLIRNSFNLDTTYPKFKNYIIDNIDEICEVLNTRWLVSICDTFVDHGDEMESQIAFNISFLVNYERLVQTNYNKNDVRDMLPIRELWDGCNSYHPTKGDTLFNIIDRLGRLNYNPKYKYLFKIHKTILDRMMENDTTIGRFYNL